MYHIMTRKDDVAQWGCVASMIDKDTAYELMAVFMKDSEWQFKMEKDDE